MYDPLELAAYLRRARDPVSGFQPSFTDQDTAGPYDFDVRSPEEVALGRHIDPVTGLSEPAPTVEDTLAEKISAWTNVKDYKTTQEITAELLRLEQEQDGLVSSLRDQTEAQFGVKQARDAMQLGQSLGGNSPIVQQLISDYNSKKAAADISFGVDTKNNIYGTKAESFRPFDHRIKELSARYNVLKEEENRAKALEDVTTHGLARDKIQQDKELRDLDTQTKQLLAKMNFSTKEEVAELERIIGKPVNSNIAIELSNNPQGMSLINDAINGKDLISADQAIMSNSKNGEYYRKIIENKSDLTVEERKNLVAYSKQLEKVVSDIERMPDTAFMPETKPGERISAFSTLAKDAREQQIEQARNQEKLRAVNMVKDATKKQLMTIDTASIEGSLKATIEEQNIANRIQTAIEANLGKGITISDLTSDPEAIRYMRDGLIKDVMPDELIQANPSYAVSLLRTTWDKMLNQAAVSTTNMSKHMGIAISPRNDQDIMKARKLISSFGGLYSSYLLGP